MIGALCGINNQITHLFFKLRIFMSGNIATFLMALGFVMLPQAALSKSIKQSADNKAKIAVVQNYLKQYFF